MCSCVKGGMCVCVCEGVCACVGGGRVWGVCVRGVCEGGFVCMLM